MEYQITKRMNEINTTTGNSMSEIHNTERKKLNIKEHDFIYIK